MIRRSLPLNGTYYQTTLTPWYYLGRISTGQMEKCAMAQFMGREIPSITLQMKDIVYMSDYHKHECTGKDDYEFVDAVVPVGKLRKHYTLVRCKTCGKVFGSDNPLGKYTSINPNARYTPKKKKPQVQVILEKGTVINCIKSKRHVCTGTPKVVPKTVSLFDGKESFNITYCLTCKQYFVWKDRLDLSHRNQLHGDYYKLITQYDYEKSIQPEITEAELKEATVAIEPHNFLVITSTKRCVSKGHYLQDINARIRVMTRKGKIIEIITPAIYCSTCRRHFILEEDYEAVLRYGAPLCRTVTIDSYIKMNTGKLQYNDESLLHSLGYNVNAQEGLTDRDRQQILRVVIDEGVMGKTDVLSFLDYLIRRSKGSPRLDNAREKWTRDRQFVSQYKRNPVRNADVECITVRKYKTK